MELCAGGRLPGVFKLHEGERGPSSAIFQVDVPNGAVLVKHVLNVLGADVRRQVPHVYSAVVVPSRASNHTAGHFLRVDFRNSARYKTANVFQESQRPNNTSTIKLQPTKLQILVTTTSTALSVATTKWRRCPVFEPRCAWGGGIP